MLLQGNTTYIRQAVYSYCGSSDYYGSVGDLQRVSIQAWSSYYNSFQETGAWTYSYYTDSASGIGFAHGLQEVRTPAGISTYYQYNSSRQVSRAQLSDGTVYTYSYQTHATSDYNSWAHLVTEGRPDGSTYKVYSNFLGQVLLTDLADTSSNHWYSYSEYGTGSAGNAYDASHIRLQAASSAISGYAISGGLWNQSAATPVSFTTSGLVYRYDYYDSSIGGEAPGYLSDVRVCDGYDDTTGDELLSLTYIGHTAEDQTVYQVASSSTYADGSATTTYYDYQWYTDAGHGQQVKEIRTTLPAVSASENGSGNNAYTYACYSITGNLEWSVDTNQRFSHYAYDNTQLTNPLVTTIADIDAGDLVTLGLALPTSFSYALPGLPISGQGAAEQNDYEYDATGRLTQVLGPVHDVDGVDVRTATWIAYNDVSRKIFTASGYATQSGGSWTNYTLVGPVSFVHFDGDGRILAQGQGTRTSGSGRLTASDSLATTAYTEYDYYSGQEQLQRVEQYLNPYGDDYLTTWYGYDSMGRVNRVQDSSKNITRTLYDARGFATSTWVGTKDYGYDENGNKLVWSPNTPGNLVCTESYIYDNGNDGGDGLLTSATSYVGAGSPDRVVQFGYDGRDRLQWARTDTGTSGSSQYVYSYYTYDNLDQLSETQYFHDVNGDGLGARNDDLLIGDATASYDAWGRVFQTTSYAITSSHTRGAASTSNYWYDAAGNVIKTQSGGTEQFTKAAYDGLGRLTNVYSGYDLAEEIGTTNAYAQASGIAGDKLLEQADFTYDGASNLTYVTSYQRLAGDNDTTGTLAGTSARTSYVAYWYDQIGRSTAVANYGTTAPTGGRPSVAPTTNSNPDGALLSSVTYNAVGLVNQAKDNAGNVTTYSYDFLGRLKKTVQNYVPGGTATDENITTEYVRSAGVQLSELHVTANNTSGVATTQVTKYVYGTGIDDASPAVYRNDLVRAVIYADSDDGFVNNYDQEAEAFVGNLYDNSNGYDRVEYTYNIQGDVVTAKDQNGTVHDYAYDKAGRLTSDSVSTFGANVDNTVQRIQYGYNVQGLLNTVTSYDAASGGNIVNQILMTYNDAGLLEREYQENNGAVNTATSLYTSYNYAGADKGYRLTSVQYPTTGEGGYSTTSETAQSRQIDYSYGLTDSMADALNRLDAIVDHNGSSTPDTTLAQYSLFGPRFDRHRRLQGAAGEARLHSRQLQRTGSVRAHHRSVLGQIRR